MPLDDRDIVHASTALPDGQFRVELSIPNIHCGGCIRKIEHGLSEVANVASARVNLSTKRLTVLFTDTNNPPAIGAVLAQMGFDAFLSSVGKKTEDATYRSLLKVLAVAGFAAMNVMMLSVGIWAGADAATRNSFHWLSAAIALCALLYSGRVFYVSAWRALRHGNTNMDVPISVGLCITYLMSLYDTVTGGEHAYFDAATSLLFFLLIGRTLDYTMRAKARSAIDSLQKLIPHGADLLNDDGSVSHISSDDIVPGMRLVIAAGDRVPVDGVVEQGQSEVDLSLVSGESDAVAIGADSKLISGSLNLTAPLVLRATAPMQGSYIADMIRLMERAEATRGRFTRLADRVASLYTPVVHFAAFLAFAFWMAAGANIHSALTIAVSVLIITCPCALALAVPMVQVTASRRLYEAGILLKDGAALERLAEVDAIFFDKTGTLTLKRPRLLSDCALSPDLMKLAASLAIHSRHPYAQSIADAWRSQSGRFLPATQVEETVGSGISGIIAGERYAFGKLRWAATGNSIQEAQDISGPVLAKDGNVLAEFKFEDRLRPESENVVERLQGLGKQVSILSGDSEAKVAKAAQSLKIQDFAAEYVPTQKVKIIQEAMQDGLKPLMVGDGINDAAALATAYVSLAPSTATDVGHTAADIVLLRNNLGGILTAFDIAKRARTLTMQNIGFALIYNLIAIPFAFMGEITPLVAAIAMSTSSIVVVCNALRLRASEGVALEPKRLRS